jgi:hypothetical protein
MRNALLGKLGARKPRIGPAAFAGSVAGAAVALLLLGPTGAHAQQVTLQWKLKAGDVLNYKNESEQRMTAKSTGRQRKQTRSEVIYYHWTVLSVSNEGVAEINHKIDRVTIRLDVPPYVPFAFDSKSPPAEVPEVFEAEARQLKAIVGAEFNFQMKPTGDISNIRIPESTLKAFRDALPPDKESQAMFSEQGIKDTLTQVTPSAFPEGPVEPGKNWSSKPTKQVMPGWTTVIDRVYTFQGADPSSPKLMVIGMDTRLSLEPTEALTVKIRSQEAKGTLTFDAELGRVVATRGTQKMDMSITANGQSLEQVTETSAAMTLEP